jgi:hypothetical protein
MSSEDAPAVAANASTASEDAVAKYKKLLSVARQSLEANQIKLAEKDKVIEQIHAQIDVLNRQKDTLKQALEAELNKQKQSQNDDDVNTKPRRILRRVDVDGKVWLLYDYSDTSDAWVVYNSPQEATEFLNRLSGEPLHMPHACFTPEESVSLVGTFII